MLRKESPRTCRPNIGVNGMRSAPNDGSGASTPDRDQRLPSDATALAGRTVVPDSVGREAVETIVATDRTRPVSTA